jgi:hypothetical protein
MAFSANRYYNSPYIAQIGQNLASILAPPDPAQQLAMKKMEFELARSKQLAEQQDADRAREERLRGAFGNLATATTDAGTTAPAVENMGTLADVFKSLPFGAGKSPATFLEQQGDLASAVSGATTNNALRQAYVEGATPQQVEVLTGSKYAHQRALRELMGEQAWARLMAQEGGRFDRLGIMEGGKDRRADENSDLRLLLEFMKGERQREHDATTGGGKPLDVSPADDQALGYELEDWANSLNVQIPSDQLYTAKKIASKVYQDTRNSTLALDTAKRTLYGSLNPTVNPGNPDPWGPNNWFGVIGSTPVQPFLPLRGGKTAQQILDEFERSWVAPGAAQGASQTAAQPAATGTEPQRVLVNSPEEARRLPPGTPFITPDGRTGST